MRRSVRADYSWPCRASVWRKYLYFPGAYVPAASYDVDVDTRVAASFSTVAGTGVTGRITFVTTEYSCQQCAVLHPLRGEPGPIRVRAW